MNERTITDKELIDMQDRREKALAKCDEIVGNMKVRCPNCGHQCLRKDCPAEEVLNYVVDLCPECGYDMAGDPNDL